MSALSRFAIAAVAIASLAGCHAYTGDGSFVDNGWLNYSNRFQVDLGAIDLTEPNSQVFHLRGLPRAEFVVGLDLVEGGIVTVSGDQPSHAVTVRIELVTSTGGIVILEEAPLAEWVRSFAASSPGAARLYRRGHTVDRPLPGGGASPEAVGVKAHGGHGTYFDASPRTEYLLTVTVVASNLSSPIPSRVTLVGW